MPKMTKDDLSDLIKDMVADAVGDAMSPLSEQQTAWMDQLKALEARPVILTQEQIKSKQGIGAARFVRAMAFGKGDIDKAIHFADRAWSDDLGKSVSKALQAGDFTAGGALLPPEFANEIIELLRSRTLVRAAGARVLPMDRGTLTLRKQTGGSTASYVGEGKDITKTQPATGQIVLTAKKLAALVPISNDLLTYSAGESADAFVRDDLVLQVAIREDQAFLRDDGLSDTPKGMRYWAVSANIQATNGTTSANIETDFKDLIQALEGADVRMIKPAWFMAPRSKNHLLNLRDANGNLIYPEIRNPSPTLYGWPVFVSTNIPTNLGAGSNETEVYLVDMNDAVIGESTGLEIAVDSSASYVESGSLISAFARDETLIRAIARHDFAMRHGEAVALKSDITWGT